MRTSLEKIVRGQEGGQVRGRVRESKKGSHPTRPHLNPLAGGSLGSRVDDFLFITSSIV
jgi:hypothetical protein